MMIRSTRFVAVGLSALLFALIIASPAYAQSEPSGEAVRVYTNADLALLSPLPPASESARSHPASRSSEEENWKFAADFIQRERARLDSDRAYDLERERIANEAREDRGYGVPYLGYYGYYRGPYPYGSSHGKRHGRHAVSSRLSKFPPRLECRSRTAH